MPSKKQSWPNLKRYAGVFPEGVRKATDISVRIAGLLADV
jgi:hypothetical protein